jgi:galactonate dehydratase
MSGCISAVDIDVLRISAKTCWIFVTLRSDDGFAGLGEASLLRREDAVVAALRARAEPLIGAAAAPDRFAAATPRTLPEAAADSALSQALWDLAARRRGVDLATELGGAMRARVPLYANINRRTRDRSPDGFAASARYALAAGHAAFKLAPFDEVTPGALRDGGVAEAMAIGLARAAAVREAVGPGHDVMIDCHWRFDESSAAALMPRAGDLGLVWVECPIPETRDAIPAIRRLRGLANARGMRLAGCEELVGLDSFMPFLAAGAYDVLMPDVKYCGGPQEMLRIAAAMERHGVAFSPHNPSGPVCHAASLHVCAAAGALDRLEAQFDEAPLFADLLVAPTPPCVDGQSALPAGVGTGVALDPAIVAKARIGGWSSAAGAAVA